LNSLRWIEQAAADRGKDPKDLKPFWERK
jgi:hypothetical protein